MACSGTGNAAGDQELVEKVNKLEKQIEDMSKRLLPEYPQIMYMPYGDRKRILVTGGSGFVGSHLVDRLMLEGHEVIVLDNFFTGRKRNVEHWVGHPNFQVVDHDIVNPFFIQVDEIYHLACPASPPHYMYNPVKTIKTSFLGTINMLGLAKRVRCPILLASTSEVYGDPEIHPQPETYWGHVNPIGPRACYDEGKRLAEALAFAYIKQENVSVRIARIFNTYGPRMHSNDGRVVSNFVMQALQNKPVTVYGDGSQTRSFQYVSDLIEGLTRLMASGKTGPINIGNPQEKTIKEFAHKIISKVGSSSTIVHEEAVQDDPKQRRPDITLAKEVLGWEPVVALDEGLEKTINYFRAELERKEDSKITGYIPSLELKVRCRSPLLPLYRLYHDLETGLEPIDRLLDRVHGDHPPLVEEFYGR
ncbi:unnamed protein product [Cyprideis torosa]|uniref:UDP-glucuronate decarboxylase n=1 Tax=Cyprideis torosa TaxID=163714 RepID=A0A7R8W363_9CRUS|nr:unnamed protein product [Cyprideis torosa]CAG0882669.1 unnamed protein product [Cyprideis torosa]